MIFSIQHAALFLCNMSLFIASLNSGSNGNCYYIGNSTEAVLVDAGISCRDIEVRMKKLSLDINLVKAVFISHEHTDHISGLAVLSKKYQLPVYITTATLEHSGLKLLPHLVKSFCATETIQIGTILIKAFAKYHDACDPHSFLITDGAINIGVFTDIGRTCDQLVHHFKQCHAAFLEANYDEEMLARGKYPYFLKNRIRGGHGHLSNKEALNLFNAHRSSFMSHLLLSHLSRENNSPSLVEEMFAAYANGTRIVVASRYEASDVYRIEDCAVQRPVPLVKAEPIPVNPRHLQLSLF